MTSRGGSVFSGAKLWKRIYFSLERKVDRSANTASIRWIKLDSKGFDELLDSSIKDLLTTDVNTLKQRAELRDGFWKLSKRVNN